VKKKLSIGINQLYPDCTADPAAHIRTWEDNA